MGSRSCLLGVNSKVSIKRHFLFGSDSYLSMIHLILGPNVSYIHIKLGGHNSLSYLMFTHPGLNVHGLWSRVICLDIGKQQLSLQSSSQPQSHSSPGSTTPLPQIACCGSVKQPLALLAFAFNTGSIAFKEHGENLLLFLLSPDVALANMMKLPSSPPGVHCSGSC